jgi:NHL repeat
MTAGHIYTVAGDGTQGFSGNGGPATSAEVDHPAAVAIDGSGNLIVSDSWNHRIRVVAARTGTYYGQAMTAGHIYVVAGDGGAGFSGDGGPATSAKFQKTAGVAVDAAGNLVIADGLNNRIRVVAATSGTFYGQAMTAGDIYTVAGDGARGDTGDGGPATSAELNRSSGVTVDGAGNLVIADTDSNRVRVVAATTGSFYGQAMTAGDIYTVAGGTTHRLGDGGPATSAKLSDPSGVTVDSAGNLVIAESQGSRVRVVAATTGSFYGQAMTAGDIYTVAGDGITGFSGDRGPATSAELAFPWGVAVGTTGNLAITDVDESRVRVVAASGGTYYGQSMTAGDIYTVAGNGQVGFTGDGGPATRAELGQPDGVSMDGAGNLLVADTDNSRIRVVAATTGSFYGQSMTAGDIYTVAGGGTAFLNGVPATSTALRVPQGVAVDGAGNLVIADTEDNSVRVVAASSGTFYGQAMTAGDIYTVAGNGKAGFSGDGRLAVRARLGGPTTVAVDVAGNLVIADSGNQRIRVVAASVGRFYGQHMKTGHIYTVAGDGTPGFAGDGGAATSAELNEPQGVTVDAAGNLVIADTGNERVRVVAASFGRFYGQYMKAGHIYTVAGDGTQGFAGDGHRATGAELNIPQDVAVDAAGGLVIADSLNRRIREVVASTGSAVGR